MAELRGEVVISGAAVVFVEGLGGVGLGEEEDSLFEREEVEDSLGGREAEVDCCLRRRGSFDMPSKSESRKEGRKKEKQGCCGRGGWDENQRRSRSRRRKRKKRKKKKKGAGSSCDVTVSRVLKPREGNEQS